MLPGIETHAAQCAQFRCFSDPDYPKRHDLLVILLLVLILSLVDSLGNTCLLLAMFDPEHKCTYGPDHAVPVG